MTSTQQLQLVKVAFMGRMGANIGKTLTTAGTRFLGSGIGQSVTRNAASPGWRGWAGRALNTAGGAAGVGKRLGHIGAGILGAGATAAAGTGLYQGGRYSGATDALAGMHDAVYPMLQKLQRDHPFLWQGARMMGVDVNPEYWQSVLRQGMQQQLPQPLWWGTEKKIRANHPTYDY